jgi:DNA-binding MarR family transcriptional regulator
VADELDPVDRLTQVSSLVQGTLERRAGEHGISLIQTRLLRILRDRKPTMNELAMLLGLDKSSTSGLVDRAERRGLVCRVPSQIDRRSVRVRLTDQGSGLAQEVSALFAGDIARMLESLSADDRATLDGLLVRLVGD